MQMTTKETQNDHNGMQNGHKEAQNYHRENIYRRYHWNESLYMFPYQRCELYKNTYTYIHIYNSKTSPQTDQGQSSQNPASYVMSHEAADFIIL